MTGIYAIVPSIVATGERFNLRFKILTTPYEVGWECYTSRPGLRSPFNVSPRGIKYLDNVYDGDIGEIEIEIENRRSKFSNYHGVFFNDRRKFGTVYDLSFEKPGIHFIKVRYPEKNIEAITNPIFVMEEPRFRIFWGDLHSQTFFSDGLRCPEELYLFARDEAFLDFFSITDHSEWITDRQWEYFCAVTNDFNEDEKFTTLIAQEWTDNSFGHRNIYFPKNTGQIVRSGKDSIEKVYEVAHHYNGLVIPHHSANVSMGVNWNLAHDGDVEKLVEIYSVWGSSEINAQQGNTRPIRVLGGEKKSQHVIDALNLGYEFGFVGGGDIHDGRPGDDLHTMQGKPDIYRLLYRQGLTAVIAEKLTRDEIFNALFNRQCYATSNVRMILQFSINGISSGSFLGNPDKLDFFIKAASEVPVFKIFLISDGKIYKTFDVNKRECELKFEQLYSGEKYFYVRVQRVDGELAWIGPIWIKD
ncbi:MAG TPA: CehA/McbA family metallohydrolase [bacterium]|nr:CehA/McbA family metallohydrolase [bacterium]HOL35737.1 CehA/McbA family metallohydrolase [bacterium]HPP09068.1 CehA/McbA family metallohydrolase [bacterium]